MTLLVITLVFNICMSMLIAALGGFGFFNSYGKGDGTLSFVCFLVFLYGISNVIAVCALMQLASLPR